MRALTGFVIVAIPNPAVWTGFFHVPSRLGPHDRRWNMSDLRQHLRGLWLPLVTPFRGGSLDETSLRRLTRNYLAQAIDGFILAATSGEGMTLKPQELDRLVAIVRDEMAANRRTLPRRVMVPSE